MSDLGPLDVVTAWMVVLIAEKVGVSRWVTASAAVAVTVWTVELFLRWRSTERPWL